MPLSCARRNWHSCLLAYCGGRGFVMCCLILYVFPPSPSDLGCWRGRRPGGLGVLWPRGRCCCQASSRAVWEHKALLPRPPWAHSCTTSRWPFSRCLRWKTRTRALNGRLATAEPGLQPDARGYPFPQLPQRAFLLRPPPWWWNGET